ncbi:hypothetical protein C8F01DRAFT_1256738 [Mycena amicta]|nr:hypothetical protein C8F01DRAFT_1256738 [Mycena amicta]
MSERHHHRDHHVSLCLLAFTSPAASCCLRPPSPPLAVFFVGIVLPSSVVVSLSAFRPHLPAFSIWHAAFPHVIRDRYRGACERTVWIQVIINIPAAPKEGSGQDVSGQDVSGQDVSGQDVSGQDVSGQDVSGQDVSGQDVSGKHKVHPITLRYQSTHAAADIRIVSSSRPCTIFLPSFLPSFHPRRRGHSHRLEFSTQQLVAGLIAAVTTPSARLSSSSVFPLSIDVPLEYHIHPPEVPAVHHPSR